MYSNKKMMLLAGVAALGLTTSSLRAAVTGSFTLRAQTNWGLGVLPAGDYTFRLDQQPSGKARITLYKGTKAVMMVDNQGIEQTGTSGGSSMELVNDRVRSLRLAPTGLTYYYPSHKEEAPFLAGQRTQPDTSVLVATR